MDNLQSFSCLIPASHKVTEMKTVQFASCVTDRGNGTLQKTIIFSDSSAASINIPENNKEMLNAITNIVPDTTFRIAFKHKTYSATHSPSGLPIKSSGYKIKYWFSSSILLWDTFSLTNQLN